MLTGITVWAMHAGMSIVKSMLVSQLYIMHEHRAKDLDLFYRRKHMRLACHVLIHEYLCMYMHRIP